MNAVSILLALCQVIAFGLIGWVVGDRFLRRIGAEMVESEIGAPERTLFAIVGGVAFATALMVTNVVTGGAVFRLTPVVPVLGAAVLLTGRKSFRRPRGLKLIPIVLFVGVLLFVFAAPSFVGGSGIRSGDSPWHLGWSHQLLAGEPIPTGPAPVLGRNAYPWGWHASVATLVRLVPGSDVLIAYEALHLILLAGIPLAAAVLARRLDIAAGWPGAVAVSLIGGFGWVMARGPAFVATPAQARFGADLVVASPNSLYELFSPALPRELGLILLAASATLLVFAAHGESRSFAWGGGLVAGLLGLVSVPLFFSAIVWMVMGLVFSHHRTRSRILWAVVPALMVFALWAGPVLAAYLRFGGFVDITPRLGKEWPVTTAIGSWGLLAVLFLVGLLGSIRIARARPLLACLVGTTIVLMACLARAAFDWSLAGNATLLHQGRVWPVAHLLGAAFGGLGVVLVFRRMKRYAAVVVGAFLPILLAVAIASPVLASMGLARTISAQDEGFVYGSSDFADGSFVRDAAEFLGPDAIVRVQGSDRLAWALFQFSGVRLSEYDDPRLDGNDLRIRYRDLAREWDAQMVAGGFDPNYLVIPDPDPARYEPLVTGTFDGQTWSLVAL